MISTIHSLFKITDASPPGICNFSISFLQLKLLLATKNKIEY